MTKYNIAIDKIKTFVSAIDIANALGWEIKHGRCKCPIHNGEGYNMKLYPDDRGYVCWVCKSGGDVLRLVQETICKDEPFKNVLAWFNDTFKLGLDLDGTITPEQRRQAETARKMRMEAIEHEEWKKRMKFQVAMAADMILEAYEEMRDRNAPRTKDEQWSDAFCKAVRMIPAAKRFADDCMMEVIE